MNEPKEGRMHREVIIRRNSICVHIYLSNFKLHATIVHSLRKYVFKNKHHFFISVRYVRSIGILLKFSRQVLKL